MFFFLTTFAAEYPVEICNATRLFIKGLPDLDYETMRMISLMNQQLWPIFAHTLEPAILHFLSEAVKLGLILELPSFEEILFNE